MSLQRIESKVRRAGKGARNTLWRKQLRVDGKKVSIRLGRIPKDDAETISRHINSLAESKAAGSSIRPEPEAWLAKIDKKLRAKLEACGLINATQGVPPITWGEHREEYMERKLAVIKSRTAVNLKFAVRDFTDFIGEGTPLSEITTADAKRFWAWLIKRKSRVHTKTPKPLSPNTARRRLGRVREVFEDAVENALIPSNPFRVRSLSITVQPAEKQYVPTETIELVIKSLREDQTEYKLLLAFARHIGCRIPSEIRHLTWEDVNWQEGSITIFAQKTGRTRKVPIFEAVAPYLKEQLASTDSEYVFPTLRLRDNLATSVKKMVKRAGLEPWPKFFTALRASCETDLMDKVGIRRACQWIGNGVQVAETNYALTKGTDFDDFAASENGSKMAPLGTA